MVEFRYILILGKQLIKELNVYQEHLCYQEQLMKRLHMWLLEMKVETVSGKPLRNIAKEIYK